MRLNLLYDEGNIFCSCFGKKIIRVVYARNVNLSAAAQRHKTIKTKDYTGV